MNRPRTIALATSLVALSLTALVSCSPSPPDADASDRTLAEIRAPEDPGQAVAVLRPTAESRAAGSVRFEAMETGGLAVTADVSGLAPGPHAVHVHRYGDCRAPDGTSAGPHFPLVPLEEDARPDFITGNLGEIEVGPDGTGTFSRQVPIAELTGPRSIQGRAVVVHRGDNHPQQAPGGNAGARVACGVIGLTPAG